MTSLPISLPPGFISVVKERDAVKVGDIIAQKKAKSEASVNISELLGLSPKNTGKFLCKNPGDTVRPGDILAKKGRMLGFSEDEVVSQIMGTVSRFDREKGVLYVMLTTDVVDTNEPILSPVDGSIELCNNDKIVIKSEKDVYLGKNGVGQVGEGEIKVLEETFKTDKPTEDDLHIFVSKLTAEYIGKIVIAKYANKDLLMKAAAMGVVGVISQDINDSDLEYFESRHMMLPVVIIDEPLFDKLKKWNEKKIFLQGTLKTILLLHA